MARAQMNFPCERVARQAVKGATPVPRLAWVWIKKPCQGSDPLGAKDDDHGPLSLAFALQPDAMPEATDMQVETHSCGRRAVFFLCPGSNRQKSHDGLYPCQPNRQSTLSRVLV
jgi:hypothetical protein